MCVVGVEVDVYGGDDDPLERGVGWVEEGEGHDVDGLGAAGQDGGVYVELELVYFGGLGPEALGALPVDEHALAGGAVQEEGVDSAGDAPRGVADAALGGVEAPLGRVDVRVDARLDLGWGCEAAAAGVRRRTWLFSGNGVVVSPLSMASMRACMAVPSAAAVDGG